MERVLRCSALICLLALSGTAAAGEPGTADLLVLQSPAFPGRLAMGAAGFALAGGPDAVFGNPAMLSSGFAAGGGRWNLGTTSAAAAGGFGLGGGLRGAAGFRYLGRGDMTGRDEYGAQTGVYTYGTGLVAGGFSGDLVPGLSWGASMAVAWEKIDAATGTGFSANLGMRARTDAGLRAGLALRGLGQAPSWNGIRKDMPITLDAGAMVPVSGAVSAFAGGQLGFSTSSAASAGLRGGVSGLGLSCGYTLGEEEETSGVFGGLSYRYRAAETYTVEIATSQRDVLDWPVMAGLTVAF
ncbi:MAG: hypothetical protein R6U36_00730 [Candidatus Fermentibacteraceae bacterium]